MVNNVSLLYRLYRIKFILFLPIHFFLTLYSTILYSFALIYIHTDNKNSKLCRLYNFSNLLKNDNGR